MKFRFRDHPVDALSSSDKCSIYYSKVVDLAVLRGLLQPDPNTEIGHFAFSHHYDKGKRLARDILHAIREFNERHPEVASDRLTRKNEEFLGAVEAYRESSDKDKIKDLIVLGASYRIWPTGTSFTLSYPWDLAGNGHPVRFREDLSPFMKRRIMEILRQAGKLHDPHLFGDLESE